MWFGDHELIYRFFEILCIQIKSSNDINLASFTKELAISERDLYRQINRITGITPGHFINIIRFFGARELLLFGFSIDEIMFRVKIDSESYFYKRFKEIHNYTPQKYKDKFAPNNSIYSKLKISHNKELFFTYLIISQKASKTYYRKKVKKYVADFISDNNLHDMCIKTFLVDIYERFYITD